MTDAKAAAQWRSPSDLWLDHVSLRSDDIEWLAPARTLTLWSVKTPNGLLASRPDLVFLDIRGRSGTSLSAADGCTSLRYLQVNQVRGMAHLSVVPTLTSLEMLSLYGLPKITGLPSFTPLRRLQRAEIGSM